MPGADELKAAMGTWLGELAPWDVFSTWTFSRIVREQGAMYWARRHLSYLEKTAEQPIYAFVGAERGGNGGLIHVHALVGNVAHLKTYCGQRFAPGTWGHTCCQLHAWPCGIARVRPYDPALGASHYVAKYISKELAEWELVGFPTNAQAALNYRGGSTSTAPRVDVHRNLGLDTIVGYPDTTGRVAWTRR